MISKYNDFNRLRNLFTKIHSHPKGKGEKCAELNGIYKKTAV